MSGAIEEIVAFVPSSRDPARFYCVTRDPATGDMRCDCKGYQYRGRCRHVLAYHADRPAEPGQAPDRNRGG